MIAYTDAGYKDGKSTHSFWIKYWDGRTVFEEKFIGFERSPESAELHSLIKLLQFLNRKDITKVRIISDCKTVVDAVNNNTSCDVDVTYLKHLLKINGSKLKWKSRKFNKRCDYNCKNVHKPKIKQGKTFDWSHVYEQKIKVN